MLATMRQPDCPSTRPLARIRPIGARWACLLLSLAASLAAAPSLAEDGPPRDGGAGAIRMRAREDWRPVGLAHIDLPLRVRARFDARDGQWASRAAQLAAPHAIATGPGLANRRAIESRIALSRPLLGRLEFEISWRTQNRLSSESPMGFGDHVVGALLRFTP